MANSGPRTYSNTIWMISGTSIFPQQIWTLTTNERVQPSNEDRVLTQEKTGVRENTQTNRINDY